MIVQVGSSPTGPKLLSKSIFFLSSDENFNSKTGLKEPFWLHFLSGLGLVYTNRSWGRENTIHHRTVFKKMTFPDEKKDFKWQKKVTLTSFRLRIEVVGRLTYDEPLKQSQIKEVKGNGFPR